MTQQQYKNPAPAIAGSPGATSASDPPVSEIYIDDDWLEALLENLALANLSRADCLALIEQLEAIERNDLAAALNEPTFASEFGRLLINSYRSAMPEIVVGGMFTAEFNHYAMRAPAAMTPDNVCDTIEIAVRQLRSLGHRAAVRQIVFFISTNIEEAMAESDDD